MNIDDFERYFATNFGDSCRIERIKAGGNKIAGIYASSVNPLSPSIELHDDGDGWHVFVGDMINYETQARVASHTGEAMALIDAAVTGGVGLYRVGIAGHFAIAGDHRRIATEARSSLLGLRYRGPIRVWEAWPRSAGNQPVGGNLNEPRASKLPPKFFVFPFYGQR